MGPHRNRSPRPLMCTVSPWQTGKTAHLLPPAVTRIYYGIGPEYFYEKELDEVAKKIVTDTSARAQELTEKSEGKRVKEQDFHKMFESITFKQAMEQYMFSMKMLLATADSGELDKLKAAALINRKMGTRLDAIIALREQEEKSGEPSLFDLIEKVENGE